MPFYSIRFPYDPLLSAKLLFKSPRFQSIENIRNASNTSPGHLVIDCLIQQENSSSIHHSSWTWVLVSFYCISSMRNLFPLLSLSHFPVTLRSFLLLFFSPCTFSSHCCSYYIGPVQSIYRLVLQCTASTGSISASASIVLMYMHPSYFISRLIINAQCDERKESKCMMFTLFTSEPVILLPDWRYNWLICGYTNTQVHEYTQLIHACTNYTRAGEGGEHQADEDDDVSNFTLLVRCALHFHICSRQLMKDTPFPGSRKRWNWVHYLQAQVEREWEVHLSSMMKKKREERRRRRKDCSNDRKEKEVTKLLCPAGVQASLWPSGTRAHSKWEQQQQQQERRSREKRKSEYTRRQANWRERVSSWFVWKGGGGEDACFFSYKNRTYKYTATSLSSKQVSLSVCFTFFSLPLSLFRSPSLLSSSYTRFHWKVTFPSLFRSVTSSSQWPAVIVQCESSLHQSSQQVASSCSSLTVLQYIIQDETERKKVFICFHGCSCC